MRRIARILALAVGAAAVLVPAQAARADGVVDLDFENVTRITGSIHRVTATLTQAMGNPPSVNMQTIDFEFSGNAAGDMDGGQAIPPEDTRCTTDATGKCSITRMSTMDGGTITIRAWHREAANNPPMGPGCSPMTPQFPMQDCDPTEGQDETMAAGMVAEPDETDVVVVNWENGELDLEEEKSFAPSGPVSFTATVREKAPTTPPAKPLLANVDAEVEDSTAIPSNKDKVPGKADTECTTDPAVGTCSLTYTAGSGNGVDTIRAWVDLNDDPGAATPTGDETAGAATVYEADTGEQANEVATPGTMTEPDTTDVVKANISSAAELNVSPETTSRAVGADSGLTASYTVGGAPTSGIKVAAAVIAGGANAGKTATCTTAANGQCPLSYIGTVAGVDKIRAAVDTDGNGQPNEGDSTEDVNEGTLPGGTVEPDTTDVVQITWTGTTPTPPPADTDCEQAKQKVKKLKKKLKKAKKADNEAKIKKLKKKLKKAKARKRAACAA